MDFSRFNEKALLLVKAPSLLSIFLAIGLWVAQSMNGVSVATDSPTYNLGDPIQVTISNGSLDRISRGGLACDDLWPLALEQLDGDGNWQPVEVPQHQCIGIAAPLFAPGDTQTQTISLALDPGRYHVLYGFDDIDNGTYLVAISDPFDVLPPSP